MESAKIIVDLLKESYSEPYQERINESKCRRQICNTAQRDTKDWHH